LLGQLTQAMGVLFEEQAEAVAHPGQQQSAASQGLIADRAQLPGCRGAVEPRMRPGPFLLVWLYPPCTLAPWLPPIIAIAQAIKSPVLGKTRLLQRFLPIGTGQAANMSPMPVDRALGTVQAGCSPGLFGATPFDPGQASTFRIERGRGIEISPLDQHATLAAIEGEAHQTVLDARLAMALF